MEIAQMPAIKPRLGVVVATWSHESGAAYAQEHTFANACPAAVIPLVCPTLFETEADIPTIAAFFQEADPDVLFLIPGNFTLDHIMPLLAEAIRLPALLWGLPTREAWGALVAVQQTLFPFKELGLPFRFITGRLDEARLWRKIIPYVRAAALIKRMRGLRVGLMGWRAQGMSDVIFDELALRSAFGVQLVNIGLTAYNRMLGAVPEDAVEAAWKRIQPDFVVESLPEPVAGHGVRSYLALKEFVAQKALQAITLECFHDHLGGPCLGFCLLNDQGIAAPCENDVPSAVLMIAAQMLSGKATFHTDIVEADYTDNWAIFHHCGNLPLSLAAPERKPELKPIRETAGPGAYGPTIQATMTAGPVTAANLVNGRGELRLCALEGEVVAGDIDLPGSGARVAFSYSLQAALEAIGNLGFGHHFVLAQGHIAAELSEWCQLSGVRYSQYP